MQSHNKSRIMLPLLMASMLPMGAAASDILSEETATHNEVSTVATESVAAATGSSQANSTGSSKEKKKDRWIDKLRATGALQTEFLIPYNLKGDKTTTPEYNCDKDVLNNTYFDLTLNAPYVSAGARFEFMEWPLPGYNKDFGGWGVRYIWATGAYKSVQVTVGDFYEQFGSGLILRLYQERSLGFDNALRGGRIKFNPGGGVHITALGGKQRRYWTWNKSWVWGADAEWEINEAFKNKFSSDYGLTVGASYVGKHEGPEDIMVPNSAILNPNPDYNYILNLPQNIAAFDGRIKLRAHDFNFLAEFATKNNDPISTNKTNGYTYRSGNAVLLSGTYSHRGFSAMLQAKRSENMTFLSKRTLDANYMLSSFINHMPAFTMTQTYALAAMYPYATAPNGEWGFQADVRYLFKKGTPLGGKYGTNVRVSASYISDLDWNYPAGVTSLNERVPGTNDFGASFWKIGNLFYSDLNLEINKKFSKKFQMTLFYLFQKFDLFALEGHGGMMTANVFVGEAQWKVAKKTQLRFEAQYLNTKKDKGDWWAGLVELSLAPHWMVTVSDQYNSGQKNNYYEVLGTYTYKANRFTFGYGKVKAGYNCSGGVCRMVPQTEGFKVTYNYTF